jgi:hypothetical protein
MRPETPRLLLTAFIGTALLIPVGEWAYFQAYTEGYYDARETEPDRDELRQIIYEATHPCAGYDFLVGPGAPDKMPDALWCLDEQQRRFAFREAQREADAKLRAPKLEPSRISSCVSEKPDTPEKPRYHYSWVLGGECEKMAEKLSSGVYGFTLCPEWSKHYYPAAVACQDEVRAWVLSECARDDLPEHMIRDCRMHDYGPWTEDASAGY